MRSRGGATGLVSCVSCVLTALLVCALGGDAAAEDSLLAASTAPLLPAPAPGPAPPYSPRRAAAMARELASAVAIARAAADAPTQVQPVGESLVLASGDAAVPFDAAVDLAKRTVTALYSGPFAHRPDHVTTIVVYSGARTFLEGLQRYGLQGRVQGNELGVYDEEHHLVVLQVAPGGIATCAHEVAHPLTDADAPLALPFIKEGIPALFEQADLSNPAEPRFGGHFRLQTLRDALKSRDPDVVATVSLRDLFGIPRTSFYDEKTRHLHFAVAREALRFMHSLGKLWAFYATYRENALEDPDGNRSFRLVFGRSPAEMNDEWLAWIGSRAAEGWQ